MTVELLGDTVLGAALNPVFQARPAGTPEEVLARLLGLLRELVTRELPRLRRAVRCESAARESWQRAPAGGRVDVVASIRTSYARAGRATPDAWLVRRAERLAETPVNRLLAAILRETETTLHHLATQDGLAGTLLRGERSLVARSLVAVRDFLAASPLGDLRAGAAPPEALIRAAARRDTEMARFGSLLAWWRRLRESRLTELRTLKRSNVLQALPTGACYEVACAAGLILALRERFAVEPAPSGEPGSFVFLTPGGSACVGFGQGRQRRYGRRAWTAALQLPGGREILVEARNATADGTADLAERLDLWCAAAPGERAAYLLTPVAGGDAREDGSTGLRVRPFLAGVATGEPSNPVAEWATLLDEIWNHATEERPHAA